MSIRQYSLLSMEIILDTEKKSIGLVEPVAAADRVFSAREVYSAFKDLWLDEASLIGYVFPLEATVDGLSVINGWEVADEDTKALLSDDGSVRAALEAGKEKS